jgi:hypothetical protein
MNNTSIVSKVIEKNNGTAAELPPPRLTRAPLDEPPESRALNAAYAHLDIDPIQFCHANEIPFAEGNVIKYITRHKTKGGARDVRKAMDYCRRILEDTYGEKP